MKNDIPAAFGRLKRPLLMTHVVAGYPDLDRSREIVATMAGQGVGLIEIQIPFSDPLADGPTITRANQQALQNGVRPEDCFKMARELAPRLASPLLIVTYGNIAFQMGLDTFAAECAQAGASGVLIPDLPFDESPLDLPSLFNRQGLCYIPLISPGMRAERLRKVLALASGFVYLTLRTGTTGAVSRVEDKGLAFIDLVRRMTTLPLAAGFGLSSPEHIRLLKNKVEAVVIGSHLINTYDRAGLRGIVEFLRLCRGEIHSGPE
jgi:tryptophan synthase alpha chain